MSRMTPHPRAFWKELVEAVERGADVRTTAERHRVKASSLRRWRTVLRREAREGGALLPVVVRPASVSSQGGDAFPSKTLEIVVGEIVVRAPAG